MFVSSKHQSKLWLCHKTVWIFSCWMSTGCCRQKSCFVYGNEWKAMMLLKPTLDRIMSFCTFSLNWKASVLVETLHPLESDVGKTQNTVYASQSIQHYFRIRFKDVWLFFRLGATGSRSLITLRVISCCCRWVSGVTIPQEMHLKNKIGTIIPRWLHGPRSWPLSGSIVVSVFIHIFAV